MKQKIEAFKPGEEKHISKLIHSVYQEFVAPEHEAHGNAYFMDFVSPENIFKRVQDQTDVLSTYKINGKIVGILSVTRKNHISLLFVDEEHHGRGIARKLIGEFIVQNKPLGVGELTVNATPFSAGIYERLGFSRESALLELNGIKFIRMRKIF